MRSKRKGKSVSTSENQAPNDQAVDLPNTPEERCALLEISLAKQTDEISRLVAERDELKADVTSLTLRISALVSEKQQLLLELSSLRQK